MLSLNRPAVSGDCSFTHPPNQFNGLAQKMEVVSYGSDTTSL